MIYRRIFPKNRTQENSHVVFSLRIGRKKTLSSHSRLESDARKEKHIIPSSKSHINTPFICLKMKKYKKLRKT